MKLVASPIGFVTIKQRVGKAPRDFGKPTFGIKFDIMLPIVKQRSFNPNHTSYAQQQHLVLSVRLFLCVWAVVVAVAGERRGYGLSVQWLHVDEDSGMA